MCTRGQAAYRSSAHRRSKIHRHLDVRTLGSPRDHQSVSFPPKAGRPSESNSYSYSNGLLLVTKRRLIGLSMSRDDAKAVYYGLTAIICNSILAPAFSAATCTVALAGGSVAKNSLYTVLNFAKSSKLVM